MAPAIPSAPPVCATDHYQRVLYARPASAPDRFATVVPKIQATMRRINAALNEESLESGGVSADYKVLCDGAGEVRVDQFVVTSGTSFNSIISAARSAGFNASNVDYTIFFDYEHPSICGVGSFASDESLSASNANNTGGDYGITYDGCWNGTATMHENGHNQGAVQYNAPFSTGDGAHCWDENDVMCYSPDGGDLHQEGTISRCADRLHFDCGHDDYFVPAPESCEYLATHWNLGSRLNRFIAFGDAAPNTPPCAGFAPSCSALSCSFTDASTDPDGVIADRSWDFGDGAMSTAASPAHTYADPGELPRPTRPLRPWRRRADARDVRLPCGDAKLRRVLPDPPAEARHLARRRPHGRRRGRGAVRNHRPSPSPRGRLSRFAPEGRAQSAAVWLASPR